MLAMEIKMGAVSSWIGLSRDHKDLIDKTRHNRLSIRYNHLILTSSQELLQEETKTRKVL